MLTIGYKTHTPSQECMELVQKFAAIKRASKIIIHPNSQSNHGPCFQLQKYEGILFTSFEHCFSISLITDTKKPTINNSNRKQIHPNHSHSLNTLTCTATRIALPEKLCLSRPGNLLRRQKRVSRRLTGACGISSVANSARPNSNIAESTVPNHVATTPIKSQEIKQIDTGPWNWHRPL